MSVTFRWVELDGLALLSDWADKTYCHSFDRAVQEFGKFDILGHNAAYHLKHR